MCMQQSTELRAENTYADGQPQQTQHIKSDKASIKCQPGQRCGKALRYGQIIYWKREC